MIDEAGQFAHLRFREGGGEHVDLAAERLASKPSLVYRAGTAAVQHAPHLREDAEHGKGFQREQDAASRTAFHLGEDAEVTLQCGGVDDEARRRKRLTWERGHSCPRLSGSGDTPVPAARTGVSLLPGSVAPRGSALGSAKDRSVLAPKSHKLTGVGDRAQLAQNVRGCGQAGACRIVENVVSHTLKVFPVADQSIPITGLPERAGLLCKFVDRSL